MPESAAQAPSEPCLRCGRCAGCHAPRGDCPVPNTSCATGTCPTGPATAAPDPACRYCGGSGIGGYVSWEMASDAGEPSMEGEPIPCSCVPVAQPTGEVPF